MEVAERVGYAHVERREGSDALEAVLVVATHADVLDARNIGDGHEGIDPVVAPGERRVRAPLRNGARVGGGEARVLVVGLRRDQLLFVAVVPGPDRRDVELADAGDLLGVFDVDVGAVDLVTREVDVVRNDVDRLRRVAADAARAGHFRSRRGVVVHLAGIGRRQAEELDALDDRVRRNGPDDLLHLDFRVVDRDREAVNVLGRVDEPSGPGLGRRGLQVRVRPARLVELGRLRAAARGRVRDVRGRSGALRPVEGVELRGDERLARGGADLERIVHRRPARVDLGIGAGTDIAAVVVIAHGAVDVDRVRERNVLFGTRDRNAHLAKVRDEVASGIEVLECGRVVPADRRARGVGQAVDVRISRKALPNVAYARRHAELAARQVERIAVNLGVK